MALYWSAMYSANVNELPGWDVYRLDSYFISKGVGTFSVSGNHPNQIKLVVVSSSAIQVQRVLPPLPPMNREVNHSSSLSCVH